MKVKRWLICAGIFLFAVAAMFLFNHTSPVFNGEKVKITDGYALDIQRMNGTDTHVLALLTGDILHIHFETTHGSLKLNISDESGTAIYNGDGELCTDFDLDIPKDGEYTISVTGKNAAGSIMIGKTH